MRSSLILAAMLVLAPPALAAPDGVTLHVKMAHVVLLPSGQGDVMVPVKLTLANKSDEAVTLHASNACGVHLWNVKDSGGEVVADREICPMIYQPQTITLVAGAQQTENDTVFLPATKFYAGETYTLNYRLWGVAGEAKFKVNQAPEN